MADTTTSRTGAPATRRDGQLLDGGRHLDGHHLNGKHPDGHHSDARLAQLEAEVVQLREAMLSQRQIGAVTGLLAARFDCTTEQAWWLLVRLSQNTNTKVRIAARILADAFNGQGRAEDAWVLAELAAHLPGHGWKASIPAPGSGSAL